MATVGVKGLDDNRRTDRQTDRPVTTGSWTTSV